MELKSNTLSYRSETKTGFDTFFQNHNAPYLLVECNSMQIVRMNHSAIRLFKLENFSEKDKIIFSELTHCNCVDHKSEKSLSEFKELIRKEGSGTRRVKLKNKKFEFEAEVVLTYLIDNSEQVEYYNISVQDITDILTNEQELTDTRELYRDIYNSLPIGISSHINGKIRSCNHQLLSMVFLDDDGIIQSPFELLFIEGDRLNIRDHIQDVEANGFKEDIVRILDRQGEEKRVTLKSFSTSFQNQNLIISLFEDYQLHEELEKQQQRADLANQANQLLENEILKHEITKQKLIESEEISKSVFKSSIDTIITSDLNNRIREVSPSACYTFGYTEEEFQGLRSSTLYRDKNQFRKVVDQLNSEGFYIGELENVRKDGSLFTSFISCSTLKNNAGEKIGFMGISRDISDIKKAEIELRESEKKYRDLFVNLGDAILITNRNNQIIDLNEAALNLLEVEKDERDDLNFSDFIIEKEEVLKEYRKSLIDNEHLSNVVIKIKTKKGRIRIVDVSSSVIIKNDKYNGSRDILRDITKETESQKIIDDQNSKIKSIFNNKADILMWTLDENFRITSMNKKFFNYVLRKFDVEFKIGDKFLENIKPFVSSEVVNGLYENYYTVTKGKPIEFEGLLRTKEDYLWLDTFLSPIKIEGKESFEIAGIALDITEKKDSQLAISKSLEEKEVLLKEVHHRVKNNLQVISSILNLQSSYVKDENTLDILRESQNRVKSMSFIHESLYRSNDFTEVNFSDYINNLVTNINHSFGIYEKQVFLNLDLGNIYLNLDQAIPCGLIINELLTNAMKYAFDDIENPELTIAMNQKNQSIQIQIDDNGKGLPDNFVLEETESLGLQLVDTLKDQLEATLTYRVEKGTKYLITFDKA